MYTANLKNLFDSFDLPSATWTSTALKNSSLDYDVVTLEDGKQELTLSVVGHNPKNIKLDVTDDKLTIKAEKPEGSSVLVKEFDVTFLIGKDYDGTKAEAKFENGLLIITIDKKLERKPKSISIKVS
jgi:HSP20 family molecular chaperone IbpA